jgi:CheY-like chemotaxis protein
MDVEMPHLDGIGATRRLRELRLGIAVVVLSASDDPTLAVLPTQPARRAT